MAEKFWPGQDPIGKRFGQGTASVAKYVYEVVGVVGNVRSFGLAREDAVRVLPHDRPVAFQAMTVVIRTAAIDPASIIPTARSIVRRASIPQLPHDAGPDDGGGRQRVGGAAAADVGATVLFGALAGLLAMVGVYGVMSYNVRRQRREYGIRLALGANPGSVQRLIIGRGASRSRCRHRDRSRRRVAADPHAEDDAERREADRSDRLPRQRSASS